MVYICWDAKKIGSFVWVPFLSYLMSNLNKLCSNEFPSFLYNLQSSLGTRMVWVRRLLLSQITRYLIDQIPSIYSPLAAMENIQLANSGNMVLHQLPYLARLMRRLD